MKYKYQICLPVWMLFSMVACEVPPSNCAQIQCSNDEICSTLCVGTVCVGGFCASTEVKK